MLSTDMPSSNRIESGTFVLYFSGAGFVSRLSGLILLIFHSFRIRKCRYSKPNIPREPPATPISIHYLQIVLPFNSMRVQSEIYNTNFAKMNCAVETKFVDISHGRCNAFTWCIIQRYGASQGSGWET